MNSIDDIRQAIDDYATERDWNQFHTPKNLAMALSVEASELLEIFQWLTAEESQQLTSEKQQQAKHELADIFVYLIRIADKLDIDLIEAVNEKMVINRQKYPADQVKGSAKKYNEYPDNS